MVKEMKKGHWMGVELNHSYTIQKREVLYNEAIILNFQAYCSAHSAIVVLSQLYRRKIFSRVHSSLIVSEKSRDFMSMDRLLESIHRQLLTYQLYSSFQWAKSKLKSYSKSHCTKRRRLKTPQWYKRGEIKKQENTKRWTK